MSRDVLPSVKVVLVSFVGGYLSMVRRMIVMLMAGDSRPRVHANVIVVALDDHLICTVVSLVMPMPVLIVVVMVSMIVMPWFRRTTTNIVILLHRTHIVLYVVPPMVMIMVVVMMVAMTRVGQRGSSTNMNIVVVSFDNHNVVVGVLRATMMIVVMVAVVMVVVAVAWIRDRGWGTTFGSCMAVRPIDVDVRSCPTFFL